MARVLVLAMAGCLTAFAGPPPAGGSEPQPDRSPASMVIFGSLEAGPAKSFAAIGLKRALGGRLDEDGLRAMATFGASREEASRRRPHGRIAKSEAQALLGYEWRLGAGLFSLYAGADVAGEETRRGATAAIAMRRGWRLQTDFWSTPSETTMLHASAYLSTLDRRVWGRVAAGWRLPAGFYAGPEVEAYRETGYHKLRLGLHLTGIELLGLHWRLAAGWQTSRDRRAEPYATLGLHWLR